MKKFSPYVMGVNCNLIEDEQYEYYPIKDKQDMSDKLDDIIEQLPDDYKLSKLDVVIYEAAQVL